MPNATRHLAETPAWEDTLWKYSKVPAAGTTDLAFQVHQCRPLESEAIDQVFRDLEGPGLALARSIPHPSPEEFLVSVFKLRLHSSCYSRVTGLRIHLCFSMKLLCGSSRYETPYGLFWTVKDFSKSRGKATSWSSQLREPSDTI